MKKIILFILFIFLAFFYTGSIPQDTEPPQVVKTFPINGSQDVGPSLTQLWVLFNEEMMDKTWSWAYDNKNDFPEMTGQPFYKENFTKNILPVKLKPNKTYIIYLNSKKFPNFKDKNGNPLLPYKWTFRTKSTSGGAPD